MKVQSFDDLFFIALEYMYDAEKQLAEALPKMRDASTTPQLKEAFEKHHKETHEHVKRMERVFGFIGKEPSSQHNTVVESMVNEANGMIRNTDTGVIRDATLVHAANQIEHWEIAAYTSLRNDAKRLSKQDAVSLIEQTLNEEKQAAEKVTEISEKYVNPQAGQVHASAGAR
jgi:ferritin-like metal-binding protein YciE